MTDDQPTAVAADNPPRRPRGRRRKPSPFPVAAGSLAAFFGLFGFLTLQLRAGNDPALGKSATATAAPKRVIVKRIERRIIVTRLLPPVEQHGGVVRAAAPAAAPAPSAPVVVQQAPAPAPAPVVTRSS
jgi:hypothetical protein